MRSLLLVLFVCCGGCAGQQLESADERRLQARDYRERFILFREQCWDRGMRVYIEAKGRPPVAGFPRPGDQYHCITR